MADLTFKSSLSAEQIDNNFRNINLFDGIMAGLEEALEYEKGKANAETFARKRSLPDVNVASVRNSLKMTQKNICINARSFKTYSRSMGMWKRECCANRVNGIIF